MYSDEAPASAATLPATTNGYEPPAAPPRPSGPRIPRQALEEWLDLPAPYEGFRIRAWVGYPQRLFTDLPAIDPDADEATQAVQARQAQDHLRDVLKRVLLEHNGWQDDDGELPQPTTDAFYDRCPTHLFNTALAVVRQAATTPPNLPPRTRRR